MDIQDEIRFAIQLARKERRIEARRSFFQILEQEPRNLTAWLWLSDLLDDRQERIAALEQALLIQPDHPAIKIRLEQLKNQPEEKLPPTAPLQKPAFETTQTRQWLDQAARLVREGKKTEALYLLRSTVKTDPTDAKLWLLLSRLEPLVEDQIEALENALKANPHLATASLHLLDLQDLIKNPILLGDHYQRTGLPDLAESNYQRAALLSNTAGERREAALRLELLREQRRNPELRIPAPTFTILRLAAGPMVLFLLISFLQSGLNLNRMEGQLIYGLLLITAGSMIIEGLSSQPRHPAIVKLFGRPGASGEQISRLAAVLLGGLLVVAAYTLFLTGAIQRLDVYRAAIFGP